jgi:hypothetical protein
MLSCKQVSELVSESLDRRLPWYQRLQVRMHLLLCASCSGFRKKMLFLRNAVRRYAARAESVEVAGSSGLSPEARERMKRALDQGNSGPANSPDPP